MAFLGGAILPAGVLDDALSGMLVTFFGLLSAGLIPAMSLLVSMSYPASYSVARIRSLDDQVGVVLERMKATLAMYVAGTVLVLVSQVGLPVWTFSVPLSDGKSLTVEDCLGRLLAGAILACLFVSLDRLRLYVVAFRQVRQLRLDLAVEEARGRLKSQAPDAAAVRNLFPTGPNHGAKVEVKASAKHER